MSVLVWIQYVLHSDIVPERFVEKSFILKKNKQTKNKSMKNYPVCKALKILLRIFVYILTSTFGATLHLPISAPRSLNFNASDVPGEIESFKTTSE